MTLIDEPLPTRLTTLANLVLEPRSVYLFGAGVEDRSGVDGAWRITMESRGVVFIEVVENDDLLTLVTPGKTSVSMTGREASAVSEVVNDAHSVYIDITGMSYSAWAPLLKALLQTAVVSVVYTEPVDYRRSENPTRGMLYALSDGFDELRPIPGFARMGRTNQADWHLVAALGFEGHRFSHVLNELEPAPSRTIPVVGVPGFRPEFASQALIANRADLDEMTISANVRFARANCPFDFFQTLQSIHRDFGGPMRLAPIGTKPHGLGAVLFALARPKSVHLVYDHPRRKAKRTLGAARVCVYDVSVFCESDLYKGVGVYEP